MSPESNDRHDLCAPYALDALDVLEREMFEEHLQTCVPCQDELRGYRATTAHLGNAAATPPPASLRDNVLAGMSQIRQEPPAVTLIESRRPRRWAAPAVAVAATIVAIVAIGGYLNERDRLADLREEQAQSQIREERMTEIMNAADARRTTAEFDDGTGVTMIGSIEHEGAVLVIGGVPDSDDHDLQLWHIRGDHHASAGLVAPGSSMNLIDDLRTTDQLAVTVEPPGGSDSPSSEPIAVMTLEDDGED